MVPASLYCNVSYYTIQNWCRVLVGAPEADTEQARWGVARPGAVFRCATQPPHR